MSPKERENLPNGKFGEDYNKLRQLALQLKPDLNELLPPEVEIYQTAARGTRSKQSYGEILSFSNQIIRLLG